jgi:hypothetical protein
MLEGVGGAAEGGLRFSVSLQHWAFISLAFWLL